MGSKRPTRWLTPALLPTMVLYTLFRPLVWLPFRWQLGLGRVLGRLGLVVGGKPRRIAQRNLSVCFPQLDEAERALLLRRHFESLGMAVFEMGFGWWASERRVRRRMHIEGIEHLDAAKSHGKGVILMTAHFTVLELCGIALGQRISGLHAVYRPYRKNALAERLVHKGRTRGVSRLLKRDNVGAIIRSLRENAVVWFANDQLVRPGKRSVLAPFFGVPAVTHTGIVDLARLSGARVVPFLPSREDNGQYRLSLLPALENFPSGDRQRDLVRVVEIIERHITSDAAQYMWTRPRFAKRPPEYADIYTDAAAPPAHVPKQAAPTEPERAVSPERVVDPVTRY